MAATQNGRGGAPRGHRTARITALVCTIGLLLAVVIGSRGFVAPANASTTGPPGVPAGAAVTASPDSNAVTVSWRPGSGAAATSYTVIAWSTTGAVAGSASCLAGCTSMVVPGLTPGSAYAFAVWALNGAWVSPAAGVTPVVTIGSGCLRSTYCITADATSASGPMSHSGAGLLDGTWLVNQASTRPLGVQSWRVDILPSATGLDFSGYDAARAAGASTVTVVVSDAWFYASDGGCGSPSPTCGAATPWSELPTYSSWVKAYVQAIEASGRHPDYWDIQNEPDADVAGGFFYTTAGAATVTPPNDMLQFEAAYAAIRSADPSAKLEGPSLSEFRTYADPSRLDMVTFLADSATANLHWDALSWHENDGYSSEAWNAYPGVKIPADVATVRALLAEYPSLGSPHLAINEFGYQDVSTVPGWYAAQLAALESSGVATANRTCWATATNPTAPSGCNAYPSTLDELLTSGAGPSADYQVLAAYSQLTGQRISTTPSDDTLSALGAIDGTGTVRLLVGRAASCVAAVNPDCDQPASATPAATSIPITVKVPWTGSAQAIVNRIPDVPGQTVSAPTNVSTSSVPVVSGVVSLTLPQVADGEAWTVTLIPAAGPVATTSPTTVPPATTVPPTTTVPPARTPAPTTTTTRPAPASTKPRPTTTTTTTPPASKQHGRTAISHRLSLM